MAERLVLDKTAPEAATYRGPAEVGTAVFKGAPEQVVPTALMATLSTQLLVAIKGRGATPLKLRVWADTAPTLYTRYRIEITLTEASVSAQQGYAAQAMPFPFLVLGAVLLVLGLVALSAWQVSRIDFGGIAKGLSMGLIAVVVAAVLVMAILGRNRSPRGQHG